MQQPLQITFRGMESSAAVDGRVRALAERLERFHDRITSCRVTIQAPHQHSRHGVQPEIHLRIGVPHGEIVVSRTGSSDAHEGLHGAIREAFGAASRKLDDALRRAERRAQPRH